MPPTTWQGGDVTDSPASGTSASTPSGSPARNLTVPARFNGPPTSGNGGWSAGALAALVAGDGPDPRTGSWPPVEVTLRQPPPLDTAMEVVDDGMLTTALHRGAAVLQARRVEQAPAALEPVPASSAAAAMTHYLGFEAHPFSTCFSCGPDRAEGDGLRIFPGEVASGESGRRRVASTWTPQPGHTDPADPSVASLPVTWSALDCIGGWSGDLLERPMVLGRITAAVEALPLVGEEHVLVGEHLGTEGRKTFTAGTLLDADGRTVATVEHVWIAIDPADFT